MKIGNRNIGPEYPPFIISELSGEHRGSLERGYEMIHAAHKAGADAIKLQCYTADTLTFPGTSDEFKITEGPWAGRTLYELYKETETPRDMLAKMIRFGQKRNITIFASVFSLVDVDFVVNLGVLAIKIASFELTDLPLIWKSASTVLPVIMSTGMGTTQEIKDAINAHRIRRPHPGNNLALLHCISSYPALPSEANLPALGPLANLLADNHGCAVGLSDHTLGVGCAAAAVAFGASIIEKHFTLNRNSGGPDSGFSLEPAEFFNLVRTRNEAWQAIQTDSAPKKSPNLAFRKSLYAVREISAGERFCKENVRSIRPAAGLAPKFYQSVLAGVATQDIKAGTPLHSSMVSVLE